MSDKRLGSDWQTVKFSNIRYESSQVVSDYQYSSMVKKASTTITSKRNDMDVVVVHGMESSWGFCEDTFACMPNINPLRLDMPWSVNNPDPDWAITDVPLSIRMNDIFSELPVKPKVVIAHSFGASALLRYLNEYGEQSLDAVILISPFYAFKDEGFDWDKLRYYSGYYQEFLENTLNLSVKKELPADIKKRMAEHIRERIGPLGCLSSLTELIRSQNIDLSKFQIPFLILTGESDFYSLPKNCLKMMESLPNGEVYVVEGSGHFCMVDEPIKVGNRISEFINKHRGTNFDRSK